VQSKYQIELLFDLTFALQQLTNANRFLPAGLPRSGKLPVLFLLTSQKSTF